MVLCFPGSVGFEDYPYFLLVWERSVEGARPVWRPLDLSMFDLFQCVYDLMIYLFQFAFQSPLIICAYLALGLLAFKSLRGLL